MIKNINEEHEELDEKQKLEELKNRSLTAYAILHEEFQRDPKFKDNINNIFQEKFSKNIMEELKNQAFDDYNELYNMFRKYSPFKAELREIIIKQFNKRDDQFKAVHFLFMHQE